MRDQKTPVIIFSVDRASREPKINIEARTDAELTLHSSGIQFTRVLGSYKGDLEHSYMVHAKHFDAIKELAKTFNQESILILDNERRASLVYTDGTLIDGHDYTKIGQFKAVDERTAKAGDAWTYRANINQYYVVRG